MILLQESVSSIISNGLKALLVKNVVVHIIFMMKITDCFICAHCGHKEDLLAHTVFSDCLDNPNSLVLGLYLCLTSKRRVTQKELAQLVTIPTKSAAILIKNTEMIDECNIQEDIIKKMFEVTENPLLKNVSYSNKNDSNRAIIPTKAG